MDKLLKDIRFGFRMLIKSPGLSFVAVVALTLGIGLTTTMFSIVYGAILRGLPYEDSEQLMHLERSNLAEGIESMEVTIHDFVDWHEQQNAFHDLSAFYMGTVNLSGPEGQPERYNGAYMMAGAFGQLGVQPILGRAFAEEENTVGAPHVIILGHRIWEDRYGADSNIVGQTVRANGETMTVIGVMPQGFEFPVRQDMWFPLRMNPLEIERGTGRTLEVFGRLKDGVSLDEARTEFAGIAQRIALEYPETNEGVSSVIKPYADEFIGDEARVLLFTMLGAVFGVLLIACANVANLLMARAAIRTKEVAIRTALGANRYRVIFQLMAEALALSVVGAVLGLGVAYIGVELFNNALTADIGVPSWIDIKIDPGVLAFVLAITLLASLASGAFPAIQASGADVNAILKDESRGSSSLRMGKLTRSLVVVQMAFSCALLVAAGLMIKSVMQLKTSDFGFDPENLFTASVGLFESDYPDRESRQRLFDDLVQRLEGRAGIQAVALTSNLPTSGSGRWWFGVEGEEYATERDFPITRRVVITPGFFDTFEAPLLQGRNFTVQDQQGALSVVIVNASFTRRFFPTGDAMGKRVRLGRFDSEREWMTIVGVVPDLWMADLDDTDHAGIYVPLTQTDASFMTITLRTAAAPLSFTSMVRAEVIALDPNLPIFNVNPMTEVIATNGWFYGVFGVLFMAFGFAALFMATIGMYGVMSFSVTRRTQEMGLRMALGAQGRDVLRLIFRQGLLQIGLGVVLGSGLALLLGRGMTVVLFNVEPSDPAILGGIVLTLVVTGLLACFAPARRATRVDPMVALRYE